MPNPRTQSIPRPPATYPYGVVFGNDSVRQTLPANVPMQPVTGPDTGIVPPTQPQPGFTARPNDQIGAVGSADYNSTVPKPFGSSDMDSRMYPAVGFEKPMDGPGTSPSNQNPFNPPELGNTTTSTPGYTGLSPSGTGLHDQPIDAPLGSKGSGTIPTIPQENIKISTGIMGGKAKRYFR